MGTIEEIMLGFWIVPVGAVFGVLCSMKARKKERSFNDWFILGFIFSVIALLIISLLPEANLKGGKLNYHIQ